jgi:hypothetical protein
MELAVLVFALAFASDAISCIWMRKAVNGNALSAALASGCLALLGGISIIAYNRAPLLLIPDILGCFFGTLVSVHFMKRRTK